jgi:hypothetical protein
LLTLVTGSMTGERADEASTSDNRAVQHVLVNTTPMEEM